jgi:hypothetical protein
MLFKDLNKHRKYTMRQARELCYPETIIEKLKQASSILEITNIMVQARLDLINSEISSQ